MTLIRFRPWASDDMQVASLVPCGSSKSFVHPSGTWPETAFAFRQQRLQDEASLPDKKKQKVAVDPLVLTERELADIKKSLGLVKAFAAASAF